ncbi:hypothetical protein J7E73_24850 [Paenibacillus albidus]|uniref:hypothetical protein n=1 Tax=Paenibacillus albidus TaxID=2041023 RepID=UPI001BE51F76|nr:hypothetical protein [Paenibacillus albidus]MBT2292297.1 hypothetical protein [Paenibacillus albidus]
MEKLQQDVWNRLTDADKEVVLRQLPDKLPLGFEYLGLQTFERYGRGLTTGVFAYKGSEFVVVPGKRVTLGWEQWQDGMDEWTAAELLESVSEYQIEDVDGFLLEQMSPVREAVIPPLLVERHIRPIGWIELPLDDPALLDEEHYKEELEKFRGSSITEYTLYNGFKLKRQDEGIRAFLFNSELTYESLLEEMAAEGFSLPSEEEWEYLYGGGCRTLFPWGDSFNYELKLRYFEEAVVGKTDEQEPYDLEQPNFFGLCFTGDPYQYEVAAGPSDYVLKGGDGGGMLCGGMGPLVGYLPNTAVYYRDIHSKELDWEDLADHMNIRRLIRLLPE